MHPNPVFRQEKHARNIEFARSRSFGVLSVNHDDGPLISHVPFLLSEDAGEIELHLVRSNPILRLLRDGPVPAVIAVSGADAYISPDWYGVDDQVPTWNYVAVHLRGMLEMLEADELHGVLTRISAHMEERLLPKKPWTSDKMDPKAYERMMRQIVPVRMAVSGVDGTWKLSQNKPDEVRLAASDALGKTGHGTMKDEIVRLMKD